MSPSESNQNCSVQCNFLNTTEDIPSANGTDFMKSLLNEEVYKTGLMMKS